MASTCILRQRAFGPHSTEPVVLGEDLLRLQKLQMTLGILMTGIGVAGGRADEYGLAGALGKINPLREILALPALSELDPNILPVLEAIDALPRALDLAHYRRVWDASPWALMSWARRGAKSEPALTKVVEGLVDYAEPGRYHINQYTVTTAEMRSAVNIIDAQRTGNKPDPRLPLLPEPGKFECFDHCEAVLRALATADATGFFLQVTQVQEL